MNRPAPELPPELVGRAFPFFIWVDPQLQLLSAGRSLCKAWPAIQAGAALNDLFEVRRPRGCHTIVDWQRHKNDLCTLLARHDVDLTLRGNAETMADGSLLLLLTPVLTSLEQLRGLHLGFNDFAKHDAVGELLMLARTAQTSALDTARLAERLKTRSKELNTILELSRNGVLACGPDGRIQHANAAVLGMLGLERGQALDLDGHALKAHIDSLLDPTQPSPDWRGLTRRDLKLTLHAQVPRPAVIEVDTRPNTEGGWITYWRDMTAESEVDRMKSEFLSTAAHELRTPMVSIFGFTELLLNRPLDEVRRKDVLSTIHRQAGLLIGMVNELLDLARIESRQGKDLQRAPVALGTLVTDSVEAMRGGLVAHRLEIEAQGVDGLLTLDRNKTSQALTNVLSNAIKYSPQGGVVMVRTLRGQLEGRPALAIQVQDAGVGMSPEQVARVCERFYRADPSGNIPGTGLGMSLVREIVELQGGRLDIDSQLGRGTTVTLWFAAQPAKGTSTRQDD